ncbi:hypothetical protein LCGC14_2737590 [marine sediment metagenome]|uniref:Uncharacterized protein n=1 Tax=marine sediment metagenome TaxID=412755 RepID=A0A0F9BEE3_9ZZZZ
MAKSTNTEGRRKTAREELAKKNQRLEAIKQETALRELTKEGQRLDALEKSGVKAVFLRFVELCKAVGNLTLAQVFAFFSRKKDED